MSIYAYLRISKDSSDLENQRADILNSKLLTDTEKPQIQWTEEIVSGTVSSENRLLGSIIQNLKKGDTLIVADVSRLGRNTLDVASVGSDIMKLKARLIFAREDWELKDDIGSEVLFFAFSLAARIERSMISARTKSALSKRKTEGKKLGRKVGYRALDSVKDEIIDYRKKGLSHERLAKLYNTSRQTVASFLKELGVEK